MTRRRLLLLSVAALGLAAVGMGVVLLMPDVRPAVTRSNFGRITEGMTKAEVVKLLGTPSDQSPNGRINYSELHNGMLGVDHEKVVWGGSDGAAIIVFDEHGRALYMTWHDVRLTFVERVRQLVHLD